MRDARDRAPPQEIEVAQAFGLGRGCIGLNEGLCGPSRYGAIYDDNRVFAANHLEILDLEEEHKKMMTVTEVLKAAS